MSYPSGVVVRNVTLPTLLDSAGQPINGVLTITPAVSLKWTATDQLVLSAPVQANIVNGTATISLPVVQAGFSLTNNVRVDAWTYSAALSLPAGSPDVNDFIFVLPYGTTAYLLDFDAPTTINGTVLTLIENLPGATGDAGPANTLTIGTVTTGSPAAATITGTAPNQVLNLTIPQGDPGAGGAATGVPIGGTALQVLQKVSVVDYDTQWYTPVKELPVGGTATQVLSKVSATDYDVQWVDTSSGATNGVPVGGTALQYLRKVSATDYALEWATLVGTVPVGGTTGQVLKKVSATNYDLQWATDASGSSAARPEVSAVVYSSSYSKKPTADTANYVYVCTGAADQAEINAAITAVVAEGGGSVQLIGDIFNISGSIVMQTGVWLRGEGLGTKINASSSFNAGMIELSSSSTHAVRVSDMTLNGASLGVHGIHWSLSGGQVFTSTPATNPDSANTVNNLFINDVGSATFAGYGLYISGANNRAGKYTDIRIQNASGCGVFANSPDSHYTNVEVGSSGSSGVAYSVTAAAPVGHGFYVGDANNMFQNCKAWYSRGAGFYVHGVRNSFANCQAQDNYSHGFHLYYGKNTFVGCQADSSGQGAGNAATGGGRAGFYLGEATAVSGCLSFDRGGQAWVQQYGFQFHAGVTCSSVTGCVTYGNGVGSQFGTAPASTTVQIVADALGM